MSTAISCIVLVQTASEPQEICQMDSGGLQGATWLSLKFLKGKLGAVFKAKNKQRNKHTGKNYHCLCKGRQASLDFFQQAT